jgi:hypothetical protein
MQSRTSQGVKKVVIVFAALIYAAAVVYGDIMFFTVISRVFPNGFLGTLAMVGAFVAGGTALLLPIALHWWHAQGTQQITGYLFYGLDFAVLALNAMLAYQVISNGHLDWFFSTWLQICPATPLICAAGWAIVFSLDTSHQMRHAQQNLEADQIEIYAQGLRNAARSPQVKSVIEQGALLHAQQQVSQLLGMSVSFQQPAQLAAPIIDSTAQILPQIDQTSTPPPKQQQGIFGKIRDAVLGTPVPSMQPLLDAAERAALLKTIEELREAAKQQSPLQQPPLDTPVASTEQMFTRAQLDEGLSKAYDQGFQHANSNGNDHTQESGGLEHLFELYKKSGESGLMTFSHWIDKIKGATAGKFNDVDPKKQ